MTKKKLIETGGSDEHKRTRLKVVIRVEKLRLFDWTRLEMNVEKTLTRKGGGASKGA